jgi:hypothetical protein
MTVPIIDVPRLQMREILAGRWRCCWNCDHWKEHVDNKGEDLREPRCEHFGERPPTEVIIVGCSDWFASGIPF